MWLPPEYQPSTSVVWPYASRFTSLQVQSTDTAIALGNDSGAAVIINMSGSGP